jgi:hypothetical protein
VGSTTIAVATPAGFDTPASKQAITATVSAPNINVGVAATGKDLQDPITITLQTAPPTPVDVTVTIADETLAVLSTDSITAGGKTVTFTGVAGLTVGTVYVQGLQKGSTTVTAQAAGYNDGNNSVTVTASGFYISTGNFTTTSTAGNSNVNLRSARLDSATLNYIEDQRIRGGLSVDVPLNSSDTNVGTVTSPVTFPSNSVSINSSFDPLTVGLTDIQLVTPAGFDVPFNRNQTITVTVNP